MSDGKRIWRDRIPDFILANVTNFIWAVCGAGSVAAILAFFDSVREMATTHPLSLALCTALAFLVGIEAHVAVIWIREKKAGPNAPKDNAPLAYQKPEPLPSEDERLAQEILDILTMLGDGKRGESYIKEKFNSSVDENYRYGHALDKLYRYGCVDGITGWDYGQDGYVATFGKNGLTARTDHYPSKLERERMDINAEIREAVRREVSKQET
jgi:hypothetical protein